jgi:23S rRNA (pseudouridine1915-N3)-methyltransferase
VKIFLYYIGKPRDAHANAMAEEYIKRSTRFATCEMREIRPLRFDPWEKHPGAFKVLLDPLGRAMDSAKLARVFEHERAGRDLVFIIGGADGLPAQWRDRADLLLALSPMTMPHELARVVLAEQIYRALTTLRGHPYPR